MLGYNWLYICGVITEDFLYFNGKNFNSKILNGFRTPPSSVNQRKTDTSVNNNYQFQIIDQ